MLEEILKVLVGVFGSLLGEAFKSEFEELNLEGETYKPSHSVCVIISRVLKHETDDERYKSMSRNLLTIKTLFDESVEGFEIPLEVLSQMPREAVLTYENMIGELKGIRTGINLWLEWTETRDHSLISANRLFEQWLNIQGLFDSARDLKAALMIRGDISKVEAEEMFRKQYQRVYKRLADQLAVASKLKDAERAVEQLFAERGNGKETE